MKKQSIACGAAVLLLNLLIVGPSCKHKNHAATELQPPNVTSQKFETQTVSQWNGQYITGTVKNMNDAKISFIAVEFYLIDDHMMPVQEVGASNDKGIEPHGEWGFRIPAMNVRARSTRIKNTVVK